MRILLIEDEDNLRKIIKANLEMENYEIVEAVNGQIAKDKVESEYFDLIILDLMLPYLSGMEILDLIKFHKHDLPVIIISAKDTSSDRIKGLKSGADDYLTKPFEIEELLLRMENLLRRSGAKKVKDGMDEYYFGPNYINFRSFKASHEKSEFDLSTKEARLMKLLISRENEVVSRQEILKYVWGYDVYPSTRTIDNFISSLRKRFESDPRNPDYIVSVRGVGYKFNNPGNR